MPVIVRRIQTLEATVAQVRLITLVVVTEQPVMTLTTDPQTLGLVVSTQGVQAQTVHLKEILTLVLHHQVGLLRTIPTVHLVTTEDHRLILLLAEARVLAAVPVLVVVLQEEVVADQAQVAALQEDQDNF